MADDTDSSELAGREVLLCVTGGIACYKSADLASGLVQSGAGVNVAMTAAAEQFVRPLTFQSLTARRVYTGLWDAAENFSSAHVSLTDAADLVIVAPATANIIAKISFGIADELVSTLCLAAHGSCEFLIAPAMNSRMWNAPPVVENVERLREWGMNFVGPAEGRLACGTTGPGRMAEPREILAETMKILNSLTR